MSLDNHRGEGDPFLGAEARSVTEPETLALASCRARRSGTNARPSDAGEDAKPRAL